MFCIGIVSHDRDFVSRCRKLAPDGVSVLQIVNYREAANFLRLHWRVVGDIKTKPTIAGNYAERFFKTEVEFHQWVMSISEIK